MWTNSSTKLRREEGKEIFEMGISSSSTWSYDLLTLLGEWGKKELLLSWWKYPKRFIAKRAGARKRSDAVTIVSLDFCRWCVVHHLLQNSRKVNRQPADTAQANPPVHRTSPVIAIWEPSCASTVDHWETAPAVIQIPLIASSGALANCFDIVGRGIYKSVARFAPPSTQPSSLHHHGTVGVQIIGSSFGKINVAPRKCLESCGFSGVHQQNPKKNDQLEEQSEDGHDGKSGSAEEN